MRCVLDTVRQNMHFWAFLKCCSYKNSLPAAYWKVLKNVNFANEALCSDVSNEIGKPAMTTSLENNNSNVDGLYSNKCALSWPRSGRNKNEFFAVWLLLLTIRNKT